MCSPQVFRVPFMPVAHDTVLFFMVIKLIVFAFRRFAPWPRVLALINLFPVASDFQLDRPSVWRMGVVHPMCIYCDLILIWEDFWFHGHSILAQFSI